MRYYRENTEGNGITLCEIAYPHILCSPSPTQEGVHVYKDVLGENHQINGPAMMGWEGFSIWFWHGYVHRPDGPALTSLGFCPKWFVYGVSLEDEYYIL